MRDRLPAETDGDGGRGSQTTGPSEILGARGGRMADTLGEAQGVVASVHSRFKMTGKEQTDRLLRAIGTHTTIIGHNDGKLGPAASRL